MAISRRVDAIVIGAGVAGLAAAQALQRAGLEVLVLEARDRAGGRIHTLRLPGWPVPLEAGAEFVHGEPPALLELADGDARKVRGVHYQRGLVDGDALWQRVMEKLDGLPARRERSVADAFGTLRWRLRTSAEERRMAAAFIEGFNAAPLPRASVKAIRQQTEAAERIGGDEAFRLPGGYDQVVKRLARGLRIELGSVVRQVRWSKRGVEVDGRSAVRAIVTLPLGVLQARTVAFEPRLPAWKERAIDALAMGAVVKVALRFAKPLWPDDLAFLHVPGAPVPTFWRPLPSKAPVIVGWAASRAAHALRRRDAVAAAVASLSDGLGRRVRPLDARAFDWQADPLSRGAYSWVPVGGLDAPAALAMPAGECLHFAGEATDVGGDPGTVHGALATGARAAHEIRQALTRRR